MRPLNPRSVQKFAGILLVAHGARRNPPNRGDRRHTTAVLSPLAREPERLGLQFEDYCEGPWWFGCDHRDSPGRRGDMVIPEPAQGKRLLLSMSIHRHRLRIA